MKLMVLIMALGFSTLVFSKSVSKRQVENLEKRITVLEQKVAKLMGASSIDGKTGLRIKDNGNQIQQGSGSRGISSTPQINETRKKEIMDTLEQYKKSKQESQKLLDELMNEDF